MTASLWMLWLAANVECGACTGADTTLNATGEVGATDDLYRSELVGLSVDAGRGPALTLSLPWLLGVAPTGSDQVWLRTPLLGLSSSWTPSRARGLALGVSPQVGLASPLPSTRALELSVPVSLSQSIGVLAFAAEVGRTFARGGGGDFSAAGSIHVALCNAIRVGAGMAVLHDFASAPRTFANLEATWAATSAVSLLAVAGVGPLGPRAVQSLGMLSLQVAL